MSLPSGLESRRFSSREVREMVRCGILDEHEKLELLDGALVVKEPQGPGHAAVTAQVAELLRRAITSGGHVRLHSPIEATEDSLPEPDVALCRGRALRYASAHPSGEDVLLAVEVADSSLTKDMRKAVAYARGGIAEYWLLDIAGEALVVHQGPCPEGAYARVTRVERDGTVRIPGTDSAIRVADVLP